MGWKEKVDIYLKKSEDALLGGGYDKIKSQHDKGKLTARERIELLVDTDTFQEMFSLVESRIDDFGLDKKECPVMGWL